ncbi:MAG: thiamine diphosphokinase [Oscillospiraceae bacterium]|nr:thiamine diphosphokinase [Oscillospiraceae bacterium]
MTTKKCCYLFGAGEAPCSRPFIGEGALVIAVDGGFSYLQENGIVPHVLIGDFDSLVLEECHVHSETQKIRLNPIKDKTDMAAALEYALNVGCNEFRIYGGTGCSSHLMANIALLIKICENGMKGELFGNKENITVIRNSRVTFSREESGYISVFSVSGKSVGVCEKGLKYTLDNHTLARDNPLGVSNEFIGTESEISVKDGMLLIIREKERRT